MSYIAKFNRAKLLEKLSPNSLAIIFGEKIKYRNNDVAYPFRQNSDFWYLTELNEPNAAAIFFKGDGKLTKDLFILFTQKLTTNYEIWNGRGVSAEELISVYGVDRIYGIDEIDVIVPELLLQAEVIYYPFKHVALTNKITIWRHVAHELSKKQHKKKSKHSLQDLLIIIHELRVIKSSLELEKIRYVTTKSAAAHNHIMSYVGKHKNLTEKQVQAEFYCYCLQHGCDDMAYQPIVAAGVNACVLHYHKNSACMIEGDLLLIDAGAEYCGYAADITRVLPISGKFSSRQKEIYNLVLFAQQQSIARIRPGETFGNIQKTIVKVLVDGLIDLKILYGDSEDLISKQVYKRFYMHNFGHFLGLDVHDVGNQQIANIDNVQLSQGMVLTIEPGLYFNPDLSLDPVWHGIGIRIEDDILVTATGAENLTELAPKQIDAIEYLMLN